MQIGRYFRKDGTEVSAHHRSAPGSKRETTILLAVCLAVWGVSASHVQIDSGEDHRVRHEDKVVYPIVQPYHGSQP